MYRQQGESLIVRNAGLINSGISLLPQDETFRVTECPEDTDIPEKVRDTVLEAVKANPDPLETQVLCTDINKDGMLQGPSVDLYRSLLKEFPGIYLIASGGVSSVDDLINLKKAGLPAAIVGKAYYEGRITLDQLSQLSQE